MNKFNVLGAVKKIVKSKTIHIQNPFDISGHYKFSETFMLNFLALKDIRTFVKSKISEENPDFQELIDAYKSLISFEELAFQGEFVNFREDKNEKAHFVATYHLYEEIVDKIKKIPSSALMKDEKGNNLVSYFNPVNLQKISDFIKDIEKTNKIKIKNINSFEFVNAFVNYFKLQNKTISFDASDLFGFGSISDYFQIYVMDGALFYVEEKIKENLNVIRQLKKTFKSNGNVELFIDDCSINIKNVDEQFIKDIKKMVMTNLMSLADEMLEAADLQGLDFEKNEIFFDKLVYDKLNPQTDLRKPETNQNETQPIKNEQIEDLVETKFKNIIGLNGVKQELKDMIKFCNKLKTINKFTMQHNHMCFVGKPGTGKTMTARLVAEVLYEAGFISSKKLTEVNAVSLQAQYIGHTAPKVQSIIDSSAGGVLFLDEAYQILDVNRDDDSFGKEAIATLIKNMEDKKDLLVIFAGYEKPTKKMIETNPGLASRISTTIRFDDYSVDELIKIAKLQAEQNGFSLSDDSIESLTNYLTQERSKSNFSNGRCVRNIIESAEKMQTRRAATEDFVLTDLDIKAAIKRLEEFDAEAKRLAESSNDDEVESSVENYLISMKSQAKAYLKYNQTKSEEDKDREIDEEAEEYIRKLKVQQRIRKKLSEEEQEQEIDLAVDDYLKQSKVRERVYKKLAEEERKTKKSRLGFGPAEND